MKATFENSVDVLVKAYMNDTLTHRKCEACACGNLLGGDRTWSSLVWNYRVAIGTRTYVIKWSDRTIETGKKVIEDHGYSVKQLTMIEDAFMGWSSIGFEMYTKDTFESLLRVVDVLADIHGVDLSVKEQAVGRFAEVHATK